MGDFRTKIQEMLENYWNNPAIYDSTNTSVEDVSAEIANAVANAVHNELMNNFYEVSAYHKTMEEKLNTLASSLTTFMTSFSAWIPIPNDGGAALKASCSASASLVAEHCVTLQSAITNLNTALETLKTDLLSYKG